MSRVWYFEIKSSFCFSRSWWPVFAFIIKSWSCEWRSRIFKISFKISQSPSSLNHRASFLQQIWKMHKAMKSTVKHQHIAEFLASVLPIPNARKKRWRDAQQHRAITLFVCIFEKALEDSIMTYYYPLYCFLKQRALLKYFIEIWFVSVILSKGLEHNGFKPFLYTEKVET